MHLALRTTFSLAVSVMVVATAGEPAWPGGAPESASPSPPATDDTTLAATPPMGWNSWNHFGCDINAEIIRETIDAIVESGMADAGYEYVNIDDCWMASERGPEGRLQPHPERFPNGIEPLADYAHSKGLKLGLYESAGTETCQGFPGSLGYEEKDAEAFAEWGVDYLKYDNCGDHRGLSARERYRRMHEALEAATAETGRPIVYSVCEWGRNRPWNWASEVGAELWRTTGDIWPRWNTDTPKGSQNSVMHILDEQVGLAEHAGPGHWNDPDMLEVGNEGLSYAEAKAHFSLWAMLAAPLLAGNDLRAMPDSTRRLLTNEEIIAVNQDPLGEQGTKIKDESNLEVWVKPLEGGARAVLLLNRWHKPATIRTTAREIGLPTGGQGDGSEYAVRDLWAHETRTSETGRIAAEVPSHGAAVYRMWRVGAETPARGDDDEQAAASSGEETGR
jgi:alpha-galactosidase